MQVDAAKLVREGLINVASAARRYASHRGGKPPHPSMVVRHITIGSKRPGDGVVVRLEAVRVPGGWRTTEAAIARFFERLTPTFDQLTPEGASLPRPPKSRAKAAEKASRQLESMGI